MRNATKTVGQILRENLCTVFNLLNLLIAVALAAVGAWKNLLFLLIIGVNTAIGIVQELRAKRRIERLTLLAQPTVTILRGGREETARPEELRAGSLLVLTAGSAVCTDCVLKEGRLEVSEAILTGESESVVKRPGDKLLSGSSVIAGRCVAEATCAPEASFAARLVEQVRRTKGGGSELLASMKKVTRLTSCFIVPLGAALLAKAVLLRHVPIADAVVATSAGLLGMLPKGLVLLISVGLAVGVIRLSKKNVLVRELHALENLAHCDVVCLDKTGTLTEGSLQVDCVLPEIDAHEFDRLMASYLAGTEDNNATFRALETRFSAVKPYETTDSVPFSSDRKWSSVTLADGRTLVLGAPERLSTRLTPEVRAWMEQGRRVLLVGLCRGAVQPETVERIGVLVLSDCLRAHAAQTVSYFYEQGVDVKILSGDSAPAAAAAAKLCGVRNADRAIDATGMTRAQLEAAIATHSVFGRVTPEQKRILVEALQKRGHRVAMTGDGVNDLPAMRQADCSAAMGNGSDATKQTAQLVLLDSDFAVLRDVIAEGRRVVGNLTKSAGVFFIKTIYSVLLCLLCLICNVDFPFIPIQITLIDAVIEAFPAFFLSFEPNDRKLEGTFLNNAVRAALPNGIAIFLCCIAVFLAAPSLGIDGRQSGLLLYLTVGIVSLAGVVKANLPMTPLHGFLSIASVIGFFCAVTLFAPILQLPLLAIQSVPLLLAVVIPGVALAAFWDIPKKPRWTK